jgi:hypothetical protein
MPANKKHSPISGVLSVIAIFRQSPLAKTRFDFFSALPELC